MVSEYGLSSVTEECLKGENVNKSRISDSHGQIEVGRDIDGAIHGIDQCINAFRVIYFVAFMKDIKPSHIISLEVWVICHSCTNIQLVL